VRVRPSLRDLCAFRTTPRTAVCKHPRFEEGVEDCRPGLFSSPPLREGTSEIGRTIPIKATGADAGHRRRQHSQPHDRLGAGSGGYRHMFGRTERWLLCGCYLGFQSIGSDQTIGPAHMCFVHCACSHNGYLARHGWPQSATAILRRLRGVAQSASQWLRGGDLQ